METRSFYVTLPSNSNMDIYPDNKKANYKVRLPRTLYLKNKYEVALVEIEYPITWDTFSQGESYKIIVKDMNRAGEHIELLIPHAHYDSISELVREINTVLAQYTEESGSLGKARLRIHRLQEKITLDLPHNLHVKFSNECCDVLGLQCGKYYNGQANGLYCYDISRGFYSLFVYCNVVEPQIVGNVYVPLLRTVAIKGDRGSYVVKTYGEPHYVPVSTDEMAVIEMNIKDDSGHDVPFTNGKVVCKLHFRQRAL